MKEHIPPVAFETGKLQTLTDLKEAQTARRMAASREHEAQEALAGDLCLIVEQGTRVNIVGYPSCAEFSSESANGTRRITRVPCYPLMRSSNEVREPRIYEGYKIFEVDEIDRALTAVIGREDIETRFAIPLNGIVDITVQPPETVTE